MHQTIIKKTCKTSMSTTVRHCLQHSAWVQTKYAILYTSLKYMRQLIFLNDMNEVLHLPTGPSLTECWPLSSVRCLKSYHGDNIGQNKRILSDWNCFTKLTQMVIAIRARDPAQYIIRRLAFKFRSDRANLNTNLAYWRSYDNTSRCIFKASLELTYA